MPRAIAPEVTTTTSTPDACSAATSSQIRATTDSRSAPVSSATIDEPELDDRDGHQLRGVQLEDDAADLDVVAGLEPGALQRARSRPSAAAAARRSACASSFSRSQRMNSRSTASPVTIQLAVGPAGDLERLRLAPGGRPRTRRPRPPPRPRAPASATGTRPSSSPRSSASPSAGRARGDQHRERDALAPLGRRPPRRPPAARDRPSTAPAAAAATASRGSCSASSRSITSKLCSGSEPSSGARSSTCTSSRVRSTCARKSWPSPAPSRRALDQPRDVGDHELAVVGVDRAQHRLQRRERVGGDLRLRARHPRQQRGLARVGQPDEADVGEQLEVQLDARPPRPAAPSRPAAAPGASAVANVLVAAPAGAAAWPA